MTPHHPSLAKLLAEVAVLVAATNAVVGNSKKDERRG